MKRGTHHALLAIDFENDSETGGFICAGIYGKVRKRHVKKIEGTAKTTYTDEFIGEGGAGLYFDNQEKCISWLSKLKANSCFIVTFNLGYDRVFMDAIIDHDTICEVSSRVITAKLKNKIKIIDLMNHVDGSLENWIGFLKMTGKWGIMKVDLKDLKRRVMNDAMATYRLGEFLEDFYYKELGIPLQLSIGASALKFFTTKFFKHYWARDNEYISQFERKAFYGGRVEVFKRGEQLTYGYDVNSMYLSIMHENPFPDPQTMMHFKNGHKEWRRYFDSYLGIWDCTICTPPGIYLPVLPFRLNKKLIFPRGVFRGIWTSIELHEAERQGYEILEVHEFVIYRKSNEYFKEFAEFIWRKRIEYKARGNRGMELVIKKLGNSLYGKFAQRNDIDGYFGRVSDYTGKIEGNYRFIEYRGETFLQIIGKNLQDSRHTFPCISAFIASYARIKLYHAMKADEDALIYCDTDSIKITSPAMNIQVGEDLGEWSIEIDGKPVKYFRPKMYGTKRKGVPKRAKLIAEYTDGETWQYDKPLRYREAIKANDTPNRWVTVIKNLLFADDKRWWWNGNDSSLPIELTILFDTDYGSVNISAIPIEFRYDIKYVQGAEGIDFASREDRLQSQIEKLERRRGGREIFQRGKGDLTKYDI